MPPKPNPTLKSWEELSEVCKVGAPVLAGEQPMRQTSHAGLSAVDAEDPARWEPHLMRPLLQPPSLVPAWSCSSSWPPPLPCSESENSEGAVWSCRGAAPLYGNIGAAGATWPNIGPRPRGRQLWATGSFLTLGPHVCFPGLRVRPALSSPVHLRLSRALLLVAGSPALPRSPGWECV